MCDVNKSSQGFRDRKNTRKFYNSRSMESIRYAVNAIQTSEICKYVSAVYLYGSCARGQQKYNSDVDLLIQMDDDFDIKKYSSQVFSLKNMIMPDDLSLPEIDAKIIVGDQWKKSDDIFYKNIRRDGKLVWQRKLT